MEQRMCLSVGKSDKNTGYICLDRR